MSPLKQATFVRGWYAPSRLDARYLGNTVAFKRRLRQSWTNPQQAAVRFPIESGLSLQNIWQISLGRADEPDVLYCGVEPAALFESRDSGESWSLRSHLNWIRDIDRPRHQRRLRFSRANE